MTLSLRTYLLGFLLALVTTFSANAQTDYWKQAPGPYGGTSVADIVRLEDGRVLAATSSGIFSSEDDGLTWTSFSEGLTNFDVRDIYGLSDGRLLVATYGSGLFRLNEATQTWIPFGLTRTYTTSVLEPVAGHILVGSNGFVHESSDGGQTWKGRSLDGFQVNVKDLASNATHVFAATSLGLFRSTDVGKTWEFASYGLEEYNILSVATDAAGVVYAGASPANGGCALYRSRGNGSIWTCIQPSTNPLLVPVLNVDAEGTLWAGGYQRLLKSQNEGSSWTAYPASKSSVQAIAFSGSSMLIGTVGLGVLRSQNAGIAWSDSNTGLRSNVQTVTTVGVGRLLVGTEGGLFESTNFGSAWQRVHPDAPLIQKITDTEVDAQGRIVAGTVAGVWRYTQGDGWQALGPPGMPSIRDLSIQPDGTIIAAYHAGLYTYSGNTWTPSPIVGPDQATRDVATIAVTESGTILAGASWDSWKKAPGIAPWELMSAGDVPWFDIQSFGRINNRVLAGTRYLGILESTDEGSSWKPLGSGLNGTEDIQAIAFDSNDRVHIATYGSGVYQMNPWTKVWLPMNRGLEDHLRVTSLGFDTAGNAYAGTLDGGLFRHVISTSTDTQEESGLPTTLRLGSPYPNPASLSVSLPVYLKAAGQVRLSVFDLLGREVLDESAFHPAAEATFKVDVSHMKAGMYLYRVQSGGQLKNGSFVVMN